MYGQDILCGISKVPFEIPHKISYPYIERYVFLYNTEILRALRFESSYVFLKRPPGLSSENYKILHRQLSENIEGAISTFKSRYAIW